MSEEEKKVIEEINKRLKNTPSGFNENYINDMKYLLNLIAKQQKEIEELHTEINERIKLKIENEQLVDTQFIPKQKVKDKIEEILNNNEYRIVFEGDAEFPDEATTIKAQEYIKLDVLQELLEGRK